jgi:hypothetical protein
MRERFRLNAWRMYLGLDVNNLSQGVLKDTYQTSTSCTYIYRFSDNC